MSYRNDYINRHKSATEQRIAEQQAANTEMTNQYIQDINSVIDKSTDAAVNKVQGEIDKLPTTYQSTFDANAVNQKINERKLANRMENLGLTDSGLNRTQQTALTIQRANADAATRQQMNAASLSLKQQIADLVASGEMQKAERAATAKYDLAKQNQSVYNSMMDNLYSNARSYESSINENNNVPPKYLSENIKDQLSEVYEDDHALSILMDRLIYEGYDAQSIYDYVAELSVDYAAEEQEKAKRIEAAENALKWAASDSATIPDDPVAAIETAIKKMEDDGLENTYIYKKIKEIYNY